MFRTCPFLIIAIASYPASVRRAVGRRPKPRRACKPVGGWLPIEVGFGLTERGWAGAEAGMACEAGGGVGARRDHGDRGRGSPPERGGWPGRPWAPARRGEAAHSGAPGRDGLGAGGRGGRAASLVRGLWTRAGQQGPLPGDVPLPVGRRAVPGPTVLRLPLPRPGRAEELRGPRSRP